METISTFIDGGGSVLVAASSDIGESNLGVLVLSTMFPGSLEDFTLESWPSLGGPWPGTE